MKKLIVLFLILSLVFLTGCMVPENGYCLKYSDVNVQKADNTTYHLINGTAELKECPYGNN